MAHYEPPHLYLHCLQSQLFLFLALLSVKMSGHIVLVGQTMCAVCENSLPRSMKMKLSGSDDKPNSVFNLPQASREFSIFIKISVTILILHG